MLILHHAPRTAALVAFMLVLAGCGRPGTSVPAPPTVTAPDGVRIAYTDAGAGAPVLVFLHGWSCNKSYWDPQLRYFARTHRTVAVDLGGHGGSDTVRAAWTVEAYAADVAAVVKALDLHDVILVGHSMSGPIAVEAARSLPGRVIGIVGADTFQDVDEVPPAAAVDALISSFRKDFRAGVDAFVRGMFPRDADTTLVQRVIRDMSAAHRSVALSSMDEMFRYDIRPAIAGMRLPVRAINCDLWPTNVDGNRRHFASFDVALMHGRGHFVMLEDSTTFNRLLTEAVAALGSRR